MNLFNVSVWRYVARPPADPPLTTTSLARANPRLLSAFSEVMSPSRLAFPAKCSSVAWPDSGLTYVVVLLLSPAHEAPSQYCTSTFVQPAISGFSAVVLERYCAQRPDPRPQPSPLPGQLSQPSGFATHPRAPSIDHPLQVGHLLVEFGGARCGARAIRAVLEGDAPAAALHVDVEARGVARHHPVAGGGAIEAGGALVLGDGSQRRRQVGGSSALVRQGRLRQQQQRHLLLWGWGWLYGCGGRTAAAFIWNFSWRI